MVRGKRAAHRRQRGVKAYVAVLCLTAAVLGSGYLGWVLLGPGSVGASPGPGANSAAPRSSDAQRTSPEADASVTVVTAVTTCSQEAAAAEGVVAAAKSGVENWASHLQARTDGMSGRISAEQMRAIWKRTRIAGPDDLKRFDVAEKRYAANARTCASTANLAGTSDDTVAACRSRVTAGAEAVIAARAAVGDWAAHQAAMQKYAAGSMTAEHAQHAWARAWRAGPPNIAEFRAAVRSLQRTRACVP